MIITSVANKKLVTDVTGASTANGARVQLYSSNNTNAQKYRFESIGNGTYKIINASSDKVLDVAGGSVTGEVLPSGLVAGDRIKLDHPFVSALAITDSAGTPATLAPANYNLESPNAGLIELLDPGALVQPFKAAYTYAGRQSFTMFTAAPPERYILLDGINTETNEPVIVTLYRCKFDPVSDLAFINDEYGNFALTGSVLYDVVNAANANLGGFGRIDQKSA